MSQQNLDGALVNDILAHLGCPKKTPTLRYLNQLIHAYIRTVPWESVSRIVKRHATQEKKNCPRLPEEFWIDAQQKGFGGTCFESNLAFHSLLAALGFEGYLTVNDMNESVGCHAANTMLIKGQKYLVDVTIPVHAAIRIDPRQVVRRRTEMFDYVIRPVSGDRYEVERPGKNLFTLFDVPVSLPDYYTIMEEDYDETTGRFLDEVVMVKVVNGSAQRFFGRWRPYKLESMNRTETKEKLLDIEVLPKYLAGIFQMPEDKIAAALSIVQIPTIESTGHHLNLAITVEGNVPS